jgi:hypothetical protein
MFNLNSKNVVKISKDKGELYYNLINDNEFPIRRYIENTYEVAPSFCYPDEEFTGDILPFLLKSGKLMNFTSTGKIELLEKDSIKGVRGGSFWFAYKKVFIRLTIKNQSDEKEHLTISAGFSQSLEWSENEKEKEYSPTQIFSMGFIFPSDVQKIPLEEFVQFIHKPTKGRVHLFIKNQYGEYDFEPISVEIPDNVDLKLNYGEDFLEIDKTIKERLSEKSSGLYMFHGPPGTGKTTYIKYLAGQIDRDFIYIPTSMLEFFTSDPNSLSVLLQKPNSVLILEDAEKAIIKREDNGMASSVSSLLNLSDGIMSDILKTAVVLTYNCSRQEVDEALRRKGRLRVDYEFDLLKVEDAKELAKSLKYSDKLIETEINEKMSIADVYNLKDKVNFYEEELNDEPRIGFR